ncbi:MAG TPA: HlyD family secretion protein [Pseudomonadales bacterium]|nr:HlyD family secretion protein [Pseudomonadales bacterium]
MTASQPVLNETSSSAHTESKSIMPKLIVSGLILAVTGWLAYGWWFNLHFVETDNAQVNGHIIPMIPRVSGFITEVNVKENQPVNAGDLLVRIDDRDYKAKLAQAEADLSALVASIGDKSQVGQAVAQVKSAEAQAEAARAAVTQARVDVAKEEKDLARMRSLLQQRLVSQQQFDIEENQAQNANAKLQAAEQSLQSAEQQVQAFNAALRGADARVQAAKAVRDLAANQVSDTVIRASTSGLIAQKSVEVGQLVQVGQQLMNIVPMDDVWVVANLKETEIEGIRPGNKVEIRIDAYGKTVWTGTVDSLSPATGAKFSLLPPDNATGNFTKVVQRIPVKIKLDPAQNEDKALRAGMSAVVKIEREKAN